MAQATVINQAPPPPPDPRYIIELTLAEAKAVLKALRQVKQEALAADPNAVLDPDHEAVRKELSKTLP